MTNFRGGYLDQGSPMPLVTKSVMLTADNTLVDVRRTSMLLVSSDNTTAANRTFTLTTSPIVGHELVLVFASAASTAAELADSGTAKLSAAWTPTQYDTLKLVSDGTNWVELCRADN